MQKLKLLGKYLLFSLIFVTFGIETFASPKTNEISSYIEVSLESEDLEKTYHKITKIVDTIEGEEIFHEQKVDNWTRYFKGEPEGFDKSVQVVPYDEAERVFIALSSESGVSIVPFLNTDEMTGEGDKVKLIIHVKEIYSKEDLAMKSKIKYTSLVSSMLFTIFIVSYLFRESTKEEGEL